MLHSFPMTTQVKFSRKLWSHQQAAVTQFHNTSLNAIGLFFDMGAGKTTTAIRGYFDKCQVHKKLIKCLVLCPNGVVENWAKEFETCAGLGSKVEILTGPGAKRLELLKKTTKPIIVTNHEALTIKSLAEYLTKLKLDEGMLIVDESHRFKNPTAIRSKIIHKIADNAKYTQVLTGSPILNGYEDIWSQMRILSAGIMGSNYYAWRKKNFYNANSEKPWLKFPDWRPTKAGIAEIQRILALYCTRVKKDEVLDLPPLVRQRIYVDMSPEVKKHYTEMKKSFVTFLQEDACAADLVLTQSLRLQQIASGSVPGLKDKYSIPNNKQVALTELLPELCPRNKVIIWCYFRDPIQDIKAICDELGLYWCSIEGGQAQSVRQASIDSFRDSPKFTVLIANQGAGGVGIDGLQVANYMIYYSKSYHLELDIQSEARAHRAGSEVHKSVTRIDLITRETIEETITEALENKYTAAELALAIRKEYGNYRVERTGKKTLAA